MYLSLEIILDEQMNHTVKIVSYSVHTPAISRVISQINIPLFERYPQKNV